MSAVRKKGQSAAAHSDDGRVSSLPPLGLKPTQDTAPLTKHVHILNEFPGFQALF